MIHVAGSPIGGENPPHDKRCCGAVAIVAARADPATALRLDLLELHRTLDLDKLIRPALAGLRDPGVFTRGYRRLGALRATKTADAHVGLDIQRATTDAVAAVDHPTYPHATIAHVGLPRDGDLQSKREWREMVQGH